MTKDQISLIKEIAQKDDGTGNPLASVLSAIFNDEIMFRNTDDFVIYDDDNELIHAIKANYDNAIAGAAWPYKICTGFYGNIQFMEGLYDMKNFEKAIDQLFLNTGLIDEEKKEMIMKWASGIRNHALVPKAPGPYFPSVPQIPPKPPVCECRPDGIWHAEPIDQRTKKNIIFNMVDKAIANQTGTSMTFKKTRPATYNLTYTCDNTELANTFKGFMDTLGKELFFASLTNDIKAAIINPSVEASTDNFVTVAAEEILPQKRDVPVNIKMYIEAYGVRVRYDFCTTWVVDQEAADEWISATQSVVENYVNSIDTSGAIASATIIGKNISAVINTTDGLDVSTLGDDLASIEGLESVIWRSNNKVYVLTVGDTASYDTFEKGVYDSMPTANGQTTTGSVEMTAKNGAQLVYTLTVKYFNDEITDPVAIIGSKKYATLAEALTAAVSGDTIELQKDLTINNSAVSSTPNNPVIGLPAGVSFNGGGHTITADSASWVANPSASYGTNHIIGISGGTATISNVTLAGHATLKSGVVAYGTGTNVTIDTVTATNCGNCGVQVSGATVVLNNLTTSGNTWGAVNADKGGDGSMPAVTFNSGTMAENVEIYTEITDQDVVTAPSLTKYQGFGTNLKGFIYYTSDVSRLGTVIDGKVYETLNDVFENNDNITVAIPANTDETITIPEGKTFTLDMGGHTMTNTAGSDTIINNGTLIINGEGTIDNTENDKAPIMNNGELTILKGTITRSAEAGTADGDGGNSYYTILNHGTMTIGAVDGNDADIVISNSGAFSSLISNGWYDSEGKTPEADSCYMTINCGTFTGGKYCFKNDELGNATINGGVYSGSSETNLLNWHNMTINDGTFTMGNAKANIANGTYGQGVGHLEITGGEFNASNVPNISMINGYASSDITITGGTFTSKTGLSNYIPEGYQIDEESVPGKFVVAKISVEEQVDSFIEGLDAEGVTVEADPDTNNSYTITTSTGSIANSGIFEDILSVEGVTGITVTNGSATATYTTGGDLATFKTTVDAMVPKSNDAAPATLTMTIDVAE